MMNTSYFIIVINFGLIIKSETERITMSTNYYVKTGKKEKVICNYGCEHLIDETLHIGLYSNRWKFCLHIIPEKNINKLNDWKNILQNGRIEDEYGREISYDDMLNKIVGEYKDKGHKPKKCANECGGYYTMIDPNDGLYYVNKDELGKDGSYVLVEGEFS